MAGLGIFLIATGAAQHPVALAFVIVGLGASGAFMDLLYQVQATEFSKAGDRSVAMASSGLGWILCPLVMPMAVGWLAQHYGFRLAFACAGLFFLLIAAGTRLWHRLLVPADTGSGAFSARELKSEADA
jgi:MFS family permease